MGEAEVTEWDACDKLAAPRGQGGDNRQASPHGRGVEPGYALPRGRGNDGGRSTILRNEYPASSFLDQGGHESLIRYLSVCPERGPSLQGVSF